MANPLIQAEVLIIDDFQGIRTMLRDFVRAMGVRRVDTAANGEQALEQMRLQRYDIVVCDYNLGVGHNGQNILEEAHFNGWIDVSTIWVMVTAEKTLEMVMGTAEAKPDEYLLKPVTQNLLEARLEKLIFRKLSLRGIAGAIKVRDYASALAQCDRQMAAPGVNPSELLRIKSDVLLRIGDFNAAKAIFDAILAQRNVPWARTGLGRIRYCHGDYAGARDLFEQVLSDNKMYMEASDWLVKTLDAIGEWERAQDVLREAVRLSPRSSARQQALGEVALKNGALDLAQAAFESHIKVSEFSSRKSPSVYLGLAKVFSDQNAHQRALDVLGRTRRDFKGRPELAVQTAAIESGVHHRMGDAAKAQTALASAETLLKKLSDRPGQSVVLDMAQSLLALGQQDRACALVRDLVKNNHESLSLSRQVESLFDAAGVGDVGKALIQEARMEIVSINNHGVTLARKGELAGAVKLLRGAATRFPGNEVVLTNLCGLLLALMRTQGSTAVLQQEVRELLERVQALNPNNPKYHGYREALNQSESAA